MRRIVRWAVAVVLATMGVAAEAACLLNPSFGNEPSLQQSFDSLLGSGSVSAASDCLSNGTDARWTTTSSGGGATIVLELAGNAGSNQFGIYDLSDSSRRAVIFQGNDGAGDSALIQISGAPGNFLVSVTEDQVTRTLSLADSAFGFYLMGANGALFSHSAHNPGGRDYLYAFQGNGGMFVGGPATVVNTTFGFNDYLLAWEDLRHGDGDYQDFVVLTRGVTPVPLPSAAWLLISGLIGLVGVARTRQTV